MRSFANVLIAATPFLPRKASSIMAATGRSPTMRSLIPCAALLLALAASPAVAGELLYKAPAVAVVGWRAIRDAIYERENRIAYLEADPETDDGYKAPIIERTRAEIRHLQAMRPPAQWRWTTPCCYSRRPIYIR
jgi:hypothetical protein